jgi:hypothetical protein
VVMAVGHPASAATKPLKLVFIKLIIKTSHPGGFIFIFFIFESFYKINGGLN